ncbi:MAG: 2-amino-4-hydroxy-6-hydroxymethyldihydropteridine diphosphokinase [Magnetococcales bacterium]|nr:2-amino-4-hydroxy-6-hydroxymethyldihydropteridine diphosphokinase [Magnetococcales bacterium]
MVGSDADHPLLLAFGANLDPLPNLVHGLRRCHQELGVVAISTVYRTLPVGLIDQPDYLNGAVLIERSPDPWALRALLRAIEAECRRERHPQSKDGPRTLDLDIALMGRRVLQAPPLVIPDPEIVRRPFLACPLAELAPHLVHPLLGATLATLAAAFGPVPAGMQADDVATDVLRRAVMP